jgi:hypothetical protein
VTNRGSVPSGSHIGFPVRHIGSCLEYARDTCEIVATHAANRLRFSVHVDPDTRGQTVLRAREDLGWADSRADAVDTELQELIAKKSSGARMDAARSPGSARWPTGW